MENEFIPKILRAMKIFENKVAGIRISGILESRFKIKHLNYTLKDGELSIKDDDETYIDIDLDNIEKLYFELLENKYAVLVLVLEEGLEVEIKTINNNVVSIRDKIMESLEKSGILNSVLDDCIGAV